MIRRVCRVAASIVLLFGVTRSRAADATVTPDAALAGYARVIVAPAKTSIYLGTVSMTMPPFVRVNGGSVTLCRDRDFSSYCERIVEDQAVIHGFLDNNVSSYRVW